MNKKILFVVVTVSLGLCGIVGLFLPEQRLFHLVILAFLVLISASLGYSIHQSRETSRLERKRDQISRTELSKNKSEIAQNLESVSDALLGIKKATTENSNRLRRLSNDQIEAFDRIVNAQQSAAQRQVTYFDSIRNILEDIESGDLPISSSTLNIDTVASLVGENREAIDQLSLLIQQLSKHTLSLSNYSSQIANIKETVSEAVADLTIAPDKEAVTEVVESYSGNLVDEINKKMLVNNQNQFNKLQIAMYEETQELEALLRLQSMIEPRSVMPSLGRWAMDAKSMLQLVNIFEVNEPGLVVEIGSGTSSVWLGYLAEKYGARVVSIEHQESFADRTRSLLSEHGLLDYVDVLHAPLTDIEFNGQTYQWYQPDFIESLKEVDLLVVDGPVGTSSKKARYPALPLIVSKLSSDAVIILDDTQRKDENEIAEQWADEYSLMRVDNALSRLAVLRRMKSR